MNDNQAIPENLVVLVNIINLHDILTFLILLM